MWTNVANCPTPNVQLSPPPFFSCRRRPGPGPGTPDVDSVTFCTCNRQTTIVAPSASIPFEAEALPPPAQRDGTSGNTFTATLGFANGSGCYGITAVGQNDCGNTDNAGPQFTFNGCGGSYPSPPSARTTHARPSGPATSASNGRLQVVVNGASPSFPGRGRGFGSAKLVDGENRVEAVVVESAGKAGLWRIDLKPSESILAGSLRVISGEAVLLGPASATFRLSGAQGERIVFTFMRK